jgi:hypothetical protein
VDTSTPGSARAMTMTSFQVGMKSTHPVKKFGGIVRRLSRAKNARRTAAVQL